MGQATVRTFTTERQTGCEGRQKLCCFGQHKLSNMYECMWGGAARRFPLSGQRPFGCGIAQLTLERALNFEGDTISWINRLRRLVHEHPTPMDFAVATNLRQRTQTLCRGRCQACRQPGAPRPAHHGEKARRGSEKGGEHAGPSAHRAEPARKPGVYRKGQHTLKARAWLTRPSPRRAGRAPRHWTAPPPPRPQTCPPTRVRCCAGAGSCQSRRPPPRPCPACPRRHRWG